MQLALQQAEFAEQSGDVPVGAIVVVSGIVIASACNRTHTLHDPAGHAEVLALRQAAIVQQSPRLVGATLYATLEPCMMCLGTMIHARIDRLVYAAREPRTGAVVSAFELADSAAHNHRFDIQDGVLAEQSAALMKRFFAARR